METELIWLRSSIFSKKKNWNYILNKGISPFLQDKSRATLIKGLLIEFNYISGENIRLSIQTEIQNAKALSTEVDDYFKSFLQSSGLFAVSPQLPVNGIFMPFSQNTIQYGLYSVMGNIEPDTVKLFSVCSNCMIEALGEDDIDEEALITLAFYLHISAIAAFKEPFLKDSVLEKLYDHTILDKDEIAIREEYFKGKFLDNKPILLEIKRSIIDRSLVAPGEIPPWLVSWIDTCEKNFEMNESINQQSARNHKPINDVRKIINSQLGLTNNMTRLVNYFVTKMFVEDESVLSAV